MSGIVQPDIPRNLIYNITDANASLSVVSIVAVGTGPDGEAVTETVTSLTDYTGLKIFASITSITVATATGAGAGDEEGCAPPGASPHSASNLST